MTQLEKIWRVKTHGVQTRAKTARGAIRAYAAHVADQRPYFLGESSHHARRDTSRSDYIVQRRMQRIENAAQRATTQLASRAVRKLLAAPHGRPIIVVAGGLAPTMIGHYAYGSRWRSIPSTRRLVVGELAFEAATKINVADIQHRANLPGEYSVALDRQTRQRYAWHEKSAKFQPCGVAMLLPGIEHGARKYWEHGETVEACIAERQRKLDIAIERERRYDRTHRSERRARLVAKICHRAMVDAEMIHARGACWAGIAAWCRAHQIELTARIPLPQLYADATARPWALAIAQTLRREGAQNA